MAFQEFCGSEVWNKNSETKAVKLNEEWKEEHSTYIFNSVIFIWLHMQELRYMHTVDVLFLQHNYYEHFLLIIIPLTTILSDEAL